MDAYKGFNSSSNFFDLSLFPFHVSSRPLNGLFLADTNHPAHVIKDHINSTISESIHTFTLLNPRSESVPQSLNPYDYQLIIIHYSIAFWLDTYLPFQWQSLISNFHGITIVIHEDEYQNCNLAVHSLVKLGVNAVFSCLSSSRTASTVYQSELTSNIQFFTGLPGYISSSMINSSEYALSQNCSRLIDIGYRGRILPFSLGSAGVNKSRIGDDVSIALSDSGLVTDISSSEQDRLYGIDWYHFLASCKSVLCVEGGSSIVDYDNYITQYISNVFNSREPNHTYEQVYDSFLHHYDNNLNFHTLTPRCFEAVCCRSLLVMYPGEYSGLLQPDIHYFQLDPSLSNLADLTSLLSSTERLESIVQSAHYQIFSNPNNFHSTYVKRLDYICDTLYQTLPSLNRKHNVLEYCQSLDLRIGHIESPAHLISSAHFNELQNRVSYLERQLAIQRQHIFYPIVLFIRFLSFPIRRLLIYLNR